jgi:transposase-like protein
MGLARRKFTKELKLAAIQRLQTRATAAEVARAFEVTLKPEQESLAGYAA